MKEYFMIIERDERGWYVGNVPELSGCHTQGHTIEELTERMKEAISLCLEDSDESMFSPSEFVGVQKIAVS